MKNLFVRGHMILPFGTAKKWDIENIQLQYTSTAGLHFKTEVPVVYIDKSKQMPLMMCRANDVFGEDVWNGITGDLGYEAALGNVYKAITRHMPGATPQELQFLSGYFDHIRRYIKWDVNIAEKSTPREVKEIREARSQWWPVLLPIPQAQLYCDDPMEESGPPDPKHNFRIDFVFWDGESLVGLEIDGWEPDGYRADVRGDRLLRRAGVDLIHVMNKEIETDCGAVITRLLPRKIAYPWRYFRDKAESPDIIPF